MDKIKMTGISFYGYHGVFPEENKLGQRFVVDVELSMPLRKAGLSDELQDTINYAEIYTLLQEIVEERKYALIEALAEGLATAVLQTYACIEEVLVRVLKPNPPFAIQFDGVTVEICRRRADL